ncbi:hypothetical protein E0L36_01215 [Streptomyces sp. AJS327]|uniref:hypothetical protein n=1 Tax=Streptomyces sp. AJS327 TaxID=2545265 RepID=UPI0015DF47E3|nr:hypothetical protein [Streptomyces sp. AJS327]MBA0049577.1 hypothetical protein [Streptomyces sp. AJS327]
MPRPTPLQALFGSATVVCAALALLALTEARSVPAVLAVSAGALALGLLVSLAIPALLTAGARSGGRLRADAARRAAGLAARARMEQGTARLPEPSLRR